METQEKVSSPLDAETARELARLMAYRCLPYGFTAELAVVVAGAVGRERRRCASAMCSACADPDVYLPAVAMGGDARTWLHRRRDGQGPVRYCACYEIWAGATDTETPGGAQEGRDGEC
jgi:hypothetical protein